MLFLVLFMVYSNKSKICKDLKELFEYHKDCVVEMIKEGIC